MYMSAHQDRKGSLIKQAKDRCVAHLELRKLPLTGSGPLGSFTFYEEITIDFALRLDQFMGTEKLAREAITVNKAALQKFAKLVKAAGLTSLHAARTPAEDATITPQRIATLSPFAIVCKSLSLLTTSVR